MSQLTNYRREIALPGLWHDYANLFPMLDAAGQDALRADIQLHGVRDPVILFSDRILDGRNRYMAARDLGLDFPVADFDGTDAEALAYVLSTNLHRRHLTESQRAAVAAKLANMRQGERTDLHLSANLPKVSQSEAADMLNVSERSVTTAKKVIEQGVPELVAAVESGAVSVSAAAAVAKLPQEEQAATVAEGPKAVKAKAKTVRQKKSATDQPEDDEINRKLRRAFRKLTPQGQEDDWIGLKRAVHEEKVKARKLKAEIDLLKQRLKELSQEGQGKTIADLQAKCFRLKDAGEGHQANAARLQRQVNAQKAEIDRLKKDAENQVFPL